MKPIEKLLIKTGKASIQLRNIPDKEIKAMLVKLADTLEKNTSLLLAANKKDLATQDPANPRNDRLMLNEQRVKNIAASIRKISKLPNPSGKILNKHTLK